MSENETQEKETKPRSGRRMKAAPNAELKKRRAERMKRGSVDHGFNKRLGLDDSKLDHKNYRYRWENDTPGNISQLVAREWEVVNDEDIDGQEASRFAGYDANGKPMNTVLLRKYKEWFDEDATRSLQLHKKNMADMMRGKSELQRGAESDGQEYALETNRVSEVVGDRPVRNPDFE